MEDDKGFFINKNTCICYSLEDKELQKNAEFLSEQGHGNSHRRKQPRHGILRHDEQQRQSQHNAAENAKPRSTRFRHQFNQNVHPLFSPLST